MTLAEQIEVMQACMDGKTTEYRGKGESFWKNSPVDPLWNWSRFDYRVKPEPKVIWVNEYDRGGVYAYSSYQKAAKTSNDGANRVAVKYVEVID